MIQLYDFQRRGVEEIRSALIRSRSVVYVLDTGGGKTIIAADITGQFIRRAKRVNDGRSILFLVHRQELVDQTIEKIKLVVPDVEIGVEAASSPHPSIPWAPIQVASVSTLVKRLDRVRAPRLIVTDEAHHVRATTWETILMTWPDAWHLGLTATPERLDGRGLIRHFNEMVLGPDRDELINAHALAPMRTLAPIPPDEIADRSAIKRDRHGEFRQSEIDKRITDRVIASAVDAYVRYAPGRRAIFFGVNRSHSKNVVASMRDRGIRAAHVDGTDPVGYRRRVMDDFRTGALDVIGNVHLIDEGYDAPACDAVLLGFLTRSVTRYLQAVGRAARYDESNPDKIGLVIDLTGNSLELGTPDEPREWSLEDGEIRLETERAERTVRVCESCRTVHHEMACPTCGMEHVIEAPKETENVELVEVTRRRKRPQRAPRMSRKELNIKVREARFSADPRRALQLIAEENGYHPQWPERILAVWRATA